MSPGIDLYADRPGWGPRFLSRIYGRLVGSRFVFYRAGLLKRRRLPLWVISVGNLVVGGTGKTPATIAIGRMLTARGIKAAVLSRGYRGRNQSAVGIVSDGRDILMGPLEAGDEPYLMARSLPGVPVLVGRDRWASGWQARERFGVEAVILDDGFQHIALERNIDLLLLDAERPWGNGFLLPAGALREDISHADRATALILTRADRVSPDTVDGLKKRFPGKPIFLSRHKPSTLTTLDGETSRKPEYLSGRTVVAFCGLARPETFLNTLVGLGAEVGVFIRWPDHYRPKNKDLRLIQAKAAEIGATDVVTTAKDAVKFQPGSSWEQNSFTTWVMDVELEMVNDSGMFMDMIQPEPQPA